MNVYMFHYVNGNQFNYYHFDKDGFEKVIINLLNSGKKIISFTEFKQMIKSNDSDIDNCILLTFDDGTRDHYDIVYPILKKYNISGLFFICSNIFEHKILDVNLIHQMIANAQFEDLFSNFEKLLIEYNITKDNYDMMISTKYDDKKMLYFKQMLQFILPDNIKNEILNKLANIYNVSLNFEDYYMNVEQIKEMKENGMEFGFHTSTHKRLNKLSYDEQFKEIILNMKLLDKENIIDDDSAFSYPFGNYDSNTLNILKENGIKYAFGINEKKFTFQDNLLTIPRYDCNVLKEVLENEK